MDSNKTSIATFGAGCFWGVEEAFRKMPGVVDTVVGYMGGRPPAAGESVAYEQVCTDKTGHVEVVQVRYDSSKVSYEELLNVFWEAHDPTQVNRQGPDVGTQYRSVIFYHTPEQQQAAARSKNELQESETYRAQTIATAIEPAQEFYKAEEYHQQYLAKQGKNVCH